MTRSRHLGTTNLQCDCPSLRREIGCPPRLIRQSALPPSGYQWRFRKPLSIQFLLARGTDSCCTVCRSGYRLVRHTTPECLGRRCITLIGAPLSHHADGNANVLFVSFCIYGEENCAACGPSFRSRCTFLRAFRFDNTHSQPCFRICHFWFVLSSATSWKFLIEH